MIRITFDDDNLSDLEIAMPALSKRGMTAEFFVCSGRIGKPGYLPAGDLAEMERGGMRIGSHGVDHVDLRHLDAAALVRESEASREAIHFQVERPIDSFAIPFGSYTAVFSDHYLVMRGCTTATHSGRDIRASG